MLAASGPIRTRKSKACTLTPGQKRFVEEYPKDVDHAAAAERAGYKHPEVLGARMMTMPAVQEALSGALKARVERTHFKQDDVLRRLAEIARADPRGLFDDAGLTDKVDVALTGTTSPLVLSDAQALRCMVLKLTGTHPGGAY